MQTASAPLSLYIHIPFCATKCSYCAFNTYIQLNDLVPAFIEALCREIALVGEASGRQRAHTLFFGGGTPSLLLPDQIERILSAADTAFLLDADAEITMEANPNDLTLPYLKMVRAAGINRLSIGMQSAAAEDLTLFERRHDAQSVVDSVRDARAAGFENLSLDLIYGAPGQTLERWRATLDAALALEPEHLSLYALSLESGTPMRAAVETGHLAAPDDDLAADMYELASDDLAAHFFEQYEISNWAMPGRQSRHNLQYWLNAPYLGFGPGAHGFAGGVRYSVLLSPQRYIRALMESSDSALEFPFTPAVAEAVRPERAQEISETLIMGMRLIGRGIDRRVFQARFGQDLLEIHGAAIERYAAAGLLVVTDERVLFTDRGRLLSNMVLREFV
jgi:oxygen-independent coproporphyrinogen-3 oxidase